jgi:hypothetical protein
MLPEFGAKCRQKAKRRGGLRHRSDPFSASRSVVYKHPHSHHPIDGHTHTPLSFTPFLPTRSGRESRRLLRSRHGHVTTPAIDVPPTTYHDDLDLDQKRHFLFDSQSNGISTSFLNF